MSTGLIVPYRPRGFIRSPLRDTLYKPDSVLRHGPMLGHLHRMAARGMLLHAGAMSFDWWQHGLALPIKDQGQCCPAGTMIRMADGSERAIELVGVGESVLTAEGRVGEVQACYSRDYAGPLLEVALFGGKQSLRVSPDHPFLTVAGYTPASMLSPGAMVANFSQSPLIVSQWSTVAEIASRHFAGKLYTIKVSNGNSYVANGLGVHNCGSCWDFSGCRTATSALVLAGVGPVASFYLSAQQVLDCGQNGGCGGDDNVSVLQMCKATGLTTEALYGPYTANAGSCKVGSEQLYKIFDWGFCDGSGSGVTDTQTIKNCLVWYGVIGCGVDASQFDSYSGGVMTGNVNSSSIDHDVTITGWNDDASVPGGGWWWVDNSWGTGWGIGGRAKIAYGAWGIGTEAVFAIGKAPSPTPVPAPTTGRLAA